MVRFLDPPHYFPLMDWEPFDPYYVEVIKTYPNHYLLLVGICLFGLASPKEISYFAWIYFVVEMFLFV
jgi:hypothetical protein